MNCFPEGRAEKVAGELVKKPDLVIDLGIELKQLGIMQGGTPII